MRYPATDAHGRVYDRLIPDDGQDPFIDDCPDWCETSLAGVKHKTESCDEDRQHYGQISWVPVRSEHSEPDGDGYVLGSAMVYLHRDALHRSGWARVSPGRGSS